MYGSVKSWVTDAISARVRRLAAAVQLGVGARLGLFLVELVGPADGVGVGEGRVGFFGRVARGCRTDERHATQEGRGAGSQRRRRIGQVEQAGQGGCLCPARVLDHRPPAAIGAGRALGLRLAQDEERFGQAIVSRVGSQDLVDQPARFHRAQRQQPVDPGVCRAFHDLSPQCRCALPLASGAAASWASATRRARRSIGVGLGSASKGVTVPSGAIPRRSSSRSRSPRWAPAPPLVAFGRPLSVWRRSATTTRRRSR